mgnify:CR=1 FL=1
MEPFCKIRDFYRAITDFETRFEKRYGLCLNEGMLLCCLRQEPRLSSGDIAKQLGLTHSNTSKVIRSVEKKGLIERILGDDDKRQMYFSLTQEGERCLKELAIDCISRTPICFNISLNLSRNKFKTASEFDSDSTFDPKWRFLPLGVIICI